MLNRLPVVSVTIPGFAECKASEGMLSGLPGGSRGAGMMKADIILK